MRRNAPGMCREEILLSQIGEKELANIENSETNS